MIIIFQHILYWFGAKNLKRKANRIEIDSSEWLSVFCRLPKNCPSRRVGGSKHSTSPSIIRIYIKQM